MSDHDHNFSPSEWPFDCSTNTPAFTSQRVVRDGHAVLAVYHEDDGDWQFLHGDIEEDDEIAVICMACAFERDRSLGDLADLPIGWMASRASVESPWDREPFESDEEE
jgi:hypothetical protein